MNYFLLTRRKSNGNVLCSPIAFPEDEAKRRLIQKRRSFKATHEFQIAPAPDNHPSWFPEMEGVGRSMISINEFQKIIAEGKSKLQGQEPNWK